MDLTLHRRDEHDERRSTSPRLPAPAGAAGVLIASAGLAAAFVFAVSDLIARLG
jgi:hypothetical protein